LDGKKVFVGKFQPRAARIRDMGDQAQQFTNVFVKNFGDQMTAEKLDAMFAKFGIILSSKVMCDPEGKSKGFGFVAFDNAEDAERSVQEMDGTELEGTDLKLTVCRAQKKNERAAELKRKYEQQKAERMQRYQGVNLYVKNLDDTVDDEMLRKQFEQYGPITSAKVMGDETTRSKGFGFVCFEKPDDATKAVVEMNNKMLGNKPLYVALAQRKEDRKAQLASQYMQRLAAMRMQNPMMPGAMAGMYGPAAGGFFIPQQNQRAAAQFISGPGQMPGAPMRGGVAPRWNNIGGAGGYPMQTGPYMIPGAQGAYGQMNRPGAGGPRMGGPAGGMRQYGGYQGNQYQGGGGMGGGRFGQQHQQGRMPGMMGQAQMGGMRGGQPTPNYQMMGNPGPMAYPTYQQINQQQQQPRGMMAQPNQMQPMQNTAGIVVQNDKTFGTEFNQDPLTPAMLASAPPQEQKQMLGERLYPLIQRICKEPDVTGKITGMMLEMDNAELLMMFENEELLQAKVNEATSVLNTSKQ